MKLVSKSILAFAALGLFAACSSLGKMEKNIEDVSYQVNPNPLEVHGAKVNLSINGVFPEKYFDKKATLTLTPVLVYNGGEVAFDEVSLQGEKVTENNKSIIYKTGGKFTYNATIDYKPEYEYSTLVLNIVGVKGNKERVFERIEIGAGVIATPYLVESDENFINMPHGFTRITKHQQKAEINFLVNSSSVRSSEKRDADIKELKSFVDTVKANDAITITGVVIESHASPEGELRLNENLAVSRGKNAKSVVSSIFKRKVDDSSDEFYNMLAKGEDWLGFKALMEASEIEDKALILRILTMYDDLKKREEEIRNLAKTYTEVEDQILPKLRRSQITVNYEIVGRTDEEISALASSNPVDLSLVELLYAATLSDDLATKESILKSATEIYPTEAAAFNNYAVALVKNGKADEAKKAIESSLSIEDNAYAHNNLGAILRTVDGNLVGAKDEYSKATSLGQEVSHNIAIVNILDGEYETANNNLGSEVNFNKALAATLKGDSELALSVLKSVNEGGESANAYYLEAVVYAKLKDENNAVASLTKAIALDASLKAKAAQDRSFFYMQSTSGFQAIVK